MRRSRLGLIAGVAVVAALLSGCAADDASTTDPVSQVQVTGEYGEAPLVTVGDVSGVEDVAVREVLIEGDGPATTAESLIDANMAVYDGDTKQAAVEYQSIGNVFSAGDAALPAYFADIFVGVPAGSRVVVVVPGALMMEQSGQPVSTTSAPSAPAVIVADIDVVPGLEAWGAEQAPTQDLVSVADGEDGSPQVTVQPGAEAPSELVLDVRRAGDGEVVGDSAQVFLQYRGVLFDGGEEFDSSWTRGEPTQFSTDQVVPGFAQAIVGQSVGSQVIAIVPPHLAYGDTDNGAIPAGSTLVFVVDILAVF